jgi:hypothetical protein
MSAAPKETRTHRVDVGVALTWCGRVLFGVPAEGTSDARGPGGPIKVTTTDAFDCKVCGSSLFARRTR